MSGDHALVQSERLDLRAFTIDLIDAFLAGDRSTADAAAGAAFPIPFAPPPETGDVLNFFRAMIEADHSSALFVPRLIIDRSAKVVVGSIGVNPPDECGVAMTGYSVYPLFEGNGFASEAAKALTDYTLAGGLVRVVRATIEFSHRASQKVATRAGLIDTGRIIEDEGMTLSIWELLRHQSWPRTTPCSNCPDSAIMKRRLSR